jgi:hypothetical protein
MRVDLDQPGDHGVARGIDELPGMERVAMGLDAPDPATVDDNVDVGLKRVGAAVPEPPGVNRLRSGRRRQRPREVRIDLLHDLPGRDVDQFEAIAALVQEPARVAGPRRRSRELLGNGARRTLRRAVACDRPDGEQAVDDRSHLRAVGRPDRAVVLAHPDRLVRHRIEPAIRLAVERDPQHLIRAFAETRRVDLERTRRPARGRRATSSPGRLR